MRIVALFIFLCVVSRVANVAKKKKPTESIDWNRTYYKEKFHVCKTMKELNPVERVRARAFATQVFSRCGSQLIVKWAQKHMTPAYAIETMIHIVCWGATISYAAVADNGLTSVVPGTMANRVLDNIRLLLRGMKNLNVSFIVLFRGESFGIQPGHFMAFIQDLAVCALSDTQTGLLTQPDLDYLKHVTDYYKMILL